MLLNKRLTLRIARPFAMLGSGIMLIHYIFFNIVWPRESSNLTIWTYNIASHGIFGAALAMALLNIRRYPLGFMIGGSVGTYFWISFL